jgi:peptidoglycan/LPS O-acetylase OafA/YrhL
MKNKIFSHIQSLRALSVLFVFLYHTNIPIFSNGYLGVDIFFVISGFVITKSIFDNCEKKIINLKNFYIKRAKRIIPNLFFIVVFTYLFYLLFGPPDLSLFKEMFFALLGLSNFYYLTLSGDYFNNIFDDPLGHTWSLGVEQQFYLIYPIILFFFSMKGKNFPLNFFLFIIFFVSLYFFIINYNTNPKLSFYFSALRFWEFLIGSLLFLNKDKIKKKNFITLFCIFTIIVIALTKQNFINYYLKNIAITLSAGFLILFSNKNFLFENKFLIYLGNISYSFYLWHLPVLFFSGLYVTNVFRADIIFAFLLTLILSILTFNYVENFFRFKKKKKRSPRWRFLKSSILLFTISFLIILLYIKYFNQDLRKELRNLFYHFNYLEKKFNWSDRFIFVNNVRVDNFKVYNHCKEFGSNFELNDLGLRKECLRKNDSVKIFFLFGDSHTAQFLPLFNELSEVKNLYYLHAKYPQAEVIGSLTSNFNEIYLVTNINDLEELDKIKKYFLNIKNKKIKLILFNSTPNPSTSNEPFKCLIQNKGCFIDKNEDFKKRKLNFLFEAMYNFEKNYKDRVLVFNSYEALCSHGNINCPIYNKISRTLIFRDQTHITYEGAKSILDDFKKFLIKKELIH